MCVSVAWSVIESSGNGRWRKGSVGAKNGDSVGIVGVYVWRQSKCCSERVFNCGRLGQGI